MRTTILIIEDEPDLARLAQFNLERAGYSCVHASSGAAGVDAAVAHSPAVILLDLQLPDITGTEVLRRLKQISSVAHVPVVIVSALDSEMDRVVGFELGAADYVVKPVSQRELVLRVRRLVSAQPTGRNLLRTGPLVLDRDAVRVSVLGREVNLAPREFQLLEHLLLHRGQIFSREALLAAVWPDEATTDERTVDVHVMRLRRKLQGEGRLLETVRGQGYRLR